MSYPVGKYTVTCGVFGIANGHNWSGHWSISGPNEAEGHDSVDDGTVDGPFHAQGEAMEAARAAGIARAEEMVREDAVAGRG
jgi:hypothetical protein